MERIQIMKIISPILVKGFTKSENSTHLVEIVETSLYEESLNVVSWCGSQSA